MLTINDDWRITADERALRLERTTKNGTWATVGHYTSATTALALPVDAEHGGKPVRVAMETLAGFEKIIQEKLATGLPDRWRIEAGTVRHLRIPDPGHRLTKEGAEPTWVDVAHLPTEAMAKMMLARRLVKDAVNTDKPETAVDVGARLDALMAPVG